MSGVSAEYVMLQLSILKKEILEGIREEIKTAVKNELQDFRKEMDDKLEKNKSEQIDFVNEKLKEVEELHQIEKDSFLKRLDELEEKFKIMVVANDSLLQRCIDAEDRQRRLNIVVSNLEIDPNLTCIQNAEKMFIEKLKVPQETVNKFLYRNAHYLGREERGKGRSLIVAFLRQTDRDLIMSHGKNLKGSDISLRQNYSAETRGKKDELLKLKSSLSSDGTKLRVVERRYKPTLQILNGNKWTDYNDEF